MGNAVSSKGIVCVSASLKMLEVTEPPNGRHGNMWWSRYGGSLLAKSCLLFCIFFCFTACSAGTKCQ